MDFYKEMHLEVSFLKWELGVSQKKKKEKKKWELGGNYACRFVGIDDSDFIMY